MEGNKFCAKCGAKLEGNTKFCPGCGEPVVKAENEDVKVMAGTQAANEENVAEANTATNQSMVQEKKDVNVASGNAIDEQKKNKIIGMVAVGVVAFVAIFAVVSIFGFIFGRKPKGVVKDLFKYVYEEPDFEEVTKLVPKKYIKAMKKEFKKEGRDWETYVEDFDDSFKITMESFDEYYGDWDYSFKITETEKWDDFKVDMYEDIAKSDQNIRINIKAGRTITVKYKIFEKKGKDIIEEDQMTIDLIKVGKDWYLHPNSMITALY